MHFFFEDSYNASFDLPGRCLHEESKDFLQSLQKGLHGAHPRIGVLFFTTRSQARWRARRDTEACRPGRECREPPKAPPQLRHLPPFSHLNAEVNRMGFGNRGIFGARRTHPPSCWLRAPSCSPWFNTLVACLGGIEEPTPIQGCARLHYFYQLRLDKMTFYSYFHPPLGGVAQWPEQRNHNPLVGGSTPSSATIFCYELGI